MRIKNTLLIIGSLILIMAVILGIGIYSNIFIAGSSKKLEKSLNAVEVELEKGNVETAGQKLETLQSDWDKTRKSWSILTDHIEIDNITTTMKKMAALVKQGEVSDALAESSTLKEYITHIPRKESLTLENVM